MQASTVTPLARGRGRAPLSNDSAYRSLFRSSSSVTLMACGTPFPKPFVRSLRHPYIHPTSDKGGSRNPKEGRVEIGAETSNLDSAPISLSFTSIGGLAVSRAELQT